MVSSRTVESSFLRATVVGQGIDQRAVEIEQGGARKRIGEPRPGQGGECEVRIIHRSTFGYAAIAAVAAERMASMFRA